MLGFILPSFSSSTEISNSVSSLFRACSSSGGMVGSSSGSSLSILVNARWEIWNEWWGNTRSYISYHLIYHRPNIETLYIATFQKITSTWWEHGQASTGSDTISYIYTNLVNWELCGLKKPLRQVESFRKIVLWDSYIAGSDTISYIYTNHRLPHGGNVDKLAQVLTLYRTSTPIISGSNSQKIKSGKLRVVFNGTGKTRTIH